MYDVIRRIEEALPYDVHADANEARGVVVVSTIVAAPDAWGLGLIYVDLTLEQARDFADELGAARREVDYLGPIITADYVLDLARFCAVGGSYVEAP